MYHEFVRILLYLSKKSTTYVKNYLFLTTLLHVSMFIHPPQKVSYYVS